jgi:23S rRNA (cytidine1920-2'-O)/16S rRNA (cytidine1409-2'-O)-methyltransferase
VGSRTEARRAIDAGLVRVASHTSPKASTLVAPDEPVHLVAPPEPFVSRAGRKLDSALEAWGQSVTGLRAIDVGASTGGFTDCLLGRGVQSVVAVDVGYGQMHWRIRQDERVTVVERTNIRVADIEALGAPFDVVVADLSFISLTAVAEILAALGTDDARWFLLLKPQFEVGRTAIDRGGIVRDASVRAGAVHGVLDHFAGLGLGCQGLAVSSITGTTGNIEYMTWFSRQPRTVDAQTVDLVVEEGRP